ncbi:MAG TPA: DUF2207 domain-containing protein [Gemmatimonadaceae bacterium]
MRLLGGLAAVLLVSATAQAQRELHWRDLRVTARLDEQGALHVVETHTMVFTGDWNGGERRFDVRARQRFRFDGMRRIDSTGQAHPMTEGDLDVVDNYDFTGARTVRWRSRSPGDAPFNATPITYELTYVLSNVLQREGDTWVLDHDFAISDRSGVIENLSVTLADPAPSWQPTGAFAGRWEARNLAPGKSFVVNVPLRYAGIGDGPPVPGADPVERAILALASLVLVASFARRLVTRERETGRLTPLPSPASVDAQWLEENVFQYLPEVLGAVWDNTTSASEVAAVLARLCGEGKMRSDVRPGGRFKGPVLSLELLVDRNAFHDHERRLVDALFEAGERTTDTDRIRQRYKKTGFDPAARIRAPLEKLVKGLVPAGPTSKPPALPTFLIFLLAVALMVASVIREPADAPYVISLAAGIIVCYFIALGGAVAWRNRVHDLGAASLWFGIPLGVVVAVVLGVIITGITWASTIALAGIAALLVSCANSIFNQARSREDSERIAFRRRLATARAYFVEQLRRPEPQLEDAWFPYLIAFGLGKPMDKWFHAFGAASTGSAIGHAGFSSGSAGGAKGGGWTGFGGGGGFSGGGSSGSWVAAAGSMAAGVAAPSSSGGSSSGGGGGGGSSGGGGGGGW